jgi:hypothetical protein
VARAPQRSGPVWGTEVTEGTGLETIQASDAADWEIIIHQLDAEIA